MPGALPAGLPGGPPNAAASEAEMPAAAAEASPSPAAAAAPLSPAVACPPPPASIVTPQPRPLPVPDVEGVRGFDGEVPHGLGREARLHVLHVMQPVRRPERVAQLHVDRPDPPFLARESMPVRDD